MKTPSAGLRMGFFLVLFWSCQNTIGDATEAPPVLGQASVELPSLSLLVTQTGAFYRKSAQKKIQVVDFFFTGCPTICPKMTSHLVAVQDHFQGNGQVEILSFSIDGTNDTPEVLSRYAKNYNIKENQWKLLTGNPEGIFAISKGYKVMAYNDEFAGERNLVHDGTFVLVDHNQQIRGYYNGLDDADTQRLITDIEKLLKIL